MLKILVMTMMNSLKRHPTCRIPCEAGKTLPTQILGSRLVWPLAPPRFAASLPLHDHTSKIPVGPWAFFQPISRNLQLLGKFEKLHQQTEHLAIIALPISYSSSSSWTKVSSELLPQCNYKNRRFRLGFPILKM